MTPGLRWASVSIDLPGRLPLDLAECPVCAALVLWDHERMERHERWHGVDQ